MQIIGITGPSGSGKSVVSKYLTSRKINVIDADTIYHGIISPPSDCLDELVKHFGKGIVNGAGFLNRSALSQIVFGEENKDKLELLNQITHKYIVAKIKKLITSFKLLGEEICAIDAPLLIEAGLCSDCDFIITVLADKEIRAQRISERDKIDLDSALARISSQKPDEFYINASDYVLYNNHGIEELEKALNEILTERGVAIF